MFSKNQFPLPQSTYFVIAPGPGSNLLNNSSLVESVLVPRLLQMSMSPILMIKVDLLMDTKMEKHPLIEKGKLRNLDQEILKNPADLITGARRRDLFTQYESDGRTCDSWCSRKQVDPISDYLNSVLVFSEFFHSSWEWNPVAGYRSSISAYHDTINGFSVANHPCVCYLLKGVFNERTPAPRYTFICDVQKIITYFSTLDMSEYLHDR